MKVLLGDTVVLKVEEVQRHCGQGVADGLHLRFDAASNLR